MGPEPEKMEIGPPMPTSKMPTDEELKVRYATLEKNEKLDKISNWKLTNCAKPFDDQKDDEFLQFLDATGDNYHQLMEDSEFAIGSWLSAALDDSNVCAEMKRDIVAWFTFKERERKSVIQPLEEIREIYAGMDGFVPKTAPEAYQQKIIEDMYKSAINGIKVLTVSDKNG